MNLYVDFALVSDHDRLSEAKRYLIDLMADELASRRELAELKKKISEYEGYANQALLIPNHKLAVDIATRISQWDREVLLRQKSRNWVDGQVVRYKEIVQKMEHQLHGEKLQYILDYLDAASELADEDWKLEQKMRAAGIGKQKSDSEQVLARIKRQHAVTSV